MIFEFLPKASSGTRSRGRQCYYISPSQILTFMLVALTRNFFTMMSLHFEVLQYRCKFFILKRKIGAAAFFSSSELYPCEQPNKKLLRICFPLLPRMEWIKLKFDWSGPNKHFSLTKIVSKQTNFWGKISNHGHTLFFKTDSSTFFMQDHIGLDKPNGLIQWLSAESIIIQLPFPNSTSGHGHISLKVHNIEFFSMFGFRCMW